MKMKTEYQSEYKTVLLEYNWQFRKVYLHVSRSRESTASWYKYCGTNEDRESFTLDEENMDDTDAVEALVKQAAELSPIWHGSAGPMRQVGTITTGTF